MTYFKFTRADGSPCNGGSGKWSLPRGKRPGAWWTVEGDIEPCENGLHLCRPKDLIHWLNEVLWEAEVSGEIVAVDDKVVVRKARLIRRVETWNDKTARLFAVHCAARVLPIYEKHQPKERRVRDCILTAHRFALGNATQAELAAAWDAAWDAARAAAWDAARDAAWDAARDAAWDAARAAARDAARAAAWDAARAAARDAAWDAARDAAWDAAGDAERKWQRALLARALKNPAILEKLPKQLR